ncbi:MAG: TetR family transcriptional regulator [Deltaproteobacteria bacterium]|nr:TetR family transcriptional regulator [Deltaproteobacteria bacterium]
MPRAARPKGSEATRQALMEAGAKLFAERGFEGATVEEIVEAARVNKAMVSYHFGGKEPLYAAILEESFALLRERTAALRGASGPASERLREWIRLFAEVVAARPLLPVMIVRELIDGGERLERHGIAYLHQLLATVHEIVAQGVASGEFRAVDPFLTHLTIVGALNFFAATMRFRARVVASGQVPLSSEPTVRQFTAHLEELLIRGIENRAERRATGARRAPGRRP